MPTTAKQKHAACVAYGIKKRGGTPTAMKNMSQSKLRSWCKGPVKSEDVRPRLRSVVVEPPKVSRFEAKLVESLSDL